MRARIESGVTILSDSDPSVGRCPPSRMTVGLEFFVCRFERSARAWGYVIVPPTIKGIKIFGEGQGENLLQKVLPYYFGDTKYPSDSLAKEILMQDTGNKGEEV